MSLDFARWIDETCGSRPPEWVNEHIKRLTAAYEQYLAKFHAVVVRDRYEEL